MEPTEPQALKVYREKTERSVLKVLMVLMAPMDLMAPTGQSVRKALKVPLAQTE